MAKVGKNGDCVELQAFDVYKSPLFLREPQNIARTMLIPFLDRQNSEDS